MRLALPACVLLTACVGSGQLQTRVSGRIVGVDAQPLGPGLVLVERGRVHEGAYELGAPIDDQGRWVVDLPGGGTWAIHLFRDDYQYVPLQIIIQDHQQVVVTNMMADWGTWMDLSGQTTWPTQPDDETLLRMPFDEIVADNPVIEDVVMTWQGGDLLHVAVTVSDADDDLSKMILAFDEVTGAGYALNPPGPPDAAGNYPQGTYEMLVYTTDRHAPGSSRWAFVVSDNMCNDSPIRYETLPAR